MPTRATATCCSTLVTPICWSAITRARSTGCGKRCDGIQRIRTLITSWVRPWQLAAPRSKRRVSRSSRGSSRPSPPTSKRAQRDLAAFHLDRGRRLFEREEDREALAELRRVVYLSPYEASAHLLIGRIHLRA